MNRTLIIAEAGVNHNGDLDLALKLVEEAKRAGANIVKFQTFKAEKLTHISAKKAQYQRNNLLHEKDDSQFAMLKKLELSERDHFEIASFCKKIGIEFLSTPFDIDSLRFLVNEMNIGRIKIPSGEITNVFLLLEAARFGREIILSTGMCNLGDIEMALAILAFGLTSSKTPSSFEDVHKAYASQSGQSALRESVTLLHCTTEYPAPLSEVNLNVLDTMRQAFQLKVGYSDHTMGIAIPTAAVAKGASVIEKHFTLDRTMEGPDHLASLEPTELQDMVQSIRDVELALGCPMKVPTTTEIRNILPARKSLIVARDLEKGEKISFEDFTAKRPASGISPMRILDLIGTPASRSFKEGEVFHL